MKNICTISLSGHMTRYLHLSQPNKPALIFLPGAFMDIETSTVLHKGLSPDYDYYFLELPGTGKSFNLDAHYDLQYAALCLHHFIDQYLPSQALHLVACSYSTQIALAYAQTFSHQIKRLILLSAIKQLHKDMWSETLAAMDICINNPENLAQFFYPGLSSENAKHPKANVLQKLLARKLSKLSDEQRRSFINNSVRLFTAKPLEFSNIHCPALCLNGEHDTYTKPEWGEQLAHLLPNGHFQQVSNASHLIHIDQPTQCIALILEFLHTASINTHDSLEIA